MFQPCLILCADHLCNSFLFARKGPCTDPVPPGAAAAAAGPTTLEGLSTFISDPQACPALCLSIWRAFHAHPLPGVSQCDCL